MDIVERLQKLIALMNENGLVEMEVETEESKVRLKKPGADQPIAYAHPPMYAAPMAAAQGSVPSATSHHPSGNPQRGIVEGNSTTINSPMVGTSYLSPSPDADAFVRVGDRVSPKTVVCIIEAMKVMNEITADSEGEILEILIGSGEAVEYGQPLFALRPAR